MELNTTKHASKCPEMEEDSTSSIGESEDDPIIEEEEEDEEEEEEKGEPVEKEPWIPGVHQIEEGEHLEHDPKSYYMLHSASVNWSCLSFDILPDSLGSNRADFPHTAYVVAGTQADKTDKNKVFVMKWDKLHKTQNDGDSDSDDDKDEEDENEEDPELNFRFFAHPGTVNRIRVCPQIPRLVATWSALGSVSVWDIEEHTDFTPTPEGKLPNMRPKPKFKYTGHTTEGYAIDFNPNRAGELVTGCCDGSISLWKPKEGGWAVEAFAGKGTKKKDKSKSVEDVKWKPRNADSSYIFAAASVDKSIRVYDTRQGSSEAISIAEAHISDVNVINWNPIQHDLLLSGGDDGFTKVWDMRCTGMPIVKLKYHREPISSVDWHPTDEATFVCSSYDDTVSIWDVSVEAQGDKDENVPDQLMFQHMGQTEISEVKFHPQIPGVVLTTSCDSFNVFRPCNL